jgi:hypothetical protein
VSLSLVFNLCVLSCSSWYFMIVVLFVFSFCFFLFFLLFVSRIFCLSALFVLVFFCSQMCLCCVSLFHYLFSLCQARTVSPPISTSGTASTIAQQTNSSPSSNKIQIYINIFVLFFIYSSATSSCSLHYTAQCLVETCFKLSIISSFFCETAMNRIIEISVNLFSIKKLLN